ncbi:hypothetical protein A5712_29785 [Mycobacterium sp. E2327]|nr:hypothetical protein A5712_29785 [Mycobacterium sp. E2327]
MAFTAFRAAAVELELMIWEYAQPLSFASLRDLIAPLDTTDVRALARAEQGLDVARKRQILQATWSPWFEGIATFGELAVDPSADDAEADIGLVLLQTVDESFETSDAATFVEWFDDRRRIAETMYARAQLKEGPPRLRAYLDAYHGKYLAGYLTVRSVVSGWRRQVKRPLGGAEAYRLLMHRTRFDTRRAIPDLSLPTAHFKIEAEALLLSWIQDVAATNAEDIEAFLSANGRQIFWRDNRLVADPSPDETAAYLAESNNWYRQCVSSALHTNVGASDDVLNRVPDADEKIRTLLKVLAGGLNPKDPILADDLARYVLGQRRVLTLGRVTAPFWLEGSTEKVLYLIRTTEHGRESGMSSYDLVRMPVDSTSFHTLAAEVERLREPRMTIYRMVDLVPAHADKDRGLGRQLVAFKYGDWCHMENRGVLTDLKQVPGEFASDVETQIQPPDMVEGEYRLAEFVSVAMRTIQRLRSGTGWNVEDLVGESGIEAWTRRIIALADDVIAAAKGDPQTESDVNRRLLGKIFGEGNFTDRLIDKGIMSLDDDDPERREQLIDALYRSGFKPAPEVPWLDNAPGTAGQLFARLHGGWDVKPLVELERE